MDKNSPNFRDGRIDEARVTADYIQFKVACAKVERGYLTVDISPAPGGKFHIHFSGLGDKAIDTDRTCANGVDIMVIK
jgi:hypothetical protein